MNEEMDDILEIRDLIDRWVVYRDALLWERLRTIWHPGGEMNATWFRGPFEEFIRNNVEGLRHGLNILHILGGTAVDVKGARAVSMTKMLIQQRATLEGILCDVTCNARHYHLWERREGRWGLVSRNTILDKDRVDPVKSGERVSLDPELLSRFPVEYQHLAYLQTRAGYAVSPDCPRLSGGAALDALYRRGSDWLAEK